jgi:hypothetical protein
VVLTPFALIGLGHRLVHRLRPKDAVNKFVTLQAAAPVDDGGAACVAYYELWNWQDVDGPQLRMAASP